MAKWYAYGPMTVFSYQLFLAFTGRDPSAVYDFLPTHLIADIAQLLRISFV